MNSTKTDSTDLFLEMAKRRGYVPEACRLDGRLIFGERLRGIDPCAGCNVPRDECGGRTKP